MAFDFSTLVTDRTMADVLARNDKGSYNVIDLNRVDACLEDLVARLGRMGYNVPGYQRIKLSREAKPTSRLPEGYTELAYIQSTGEQYIDSGIIPNQDTRVYAECVLPISTGSTQALFGCRVSSSSRQFQFVTQGGYYRTDYNTTINNFTENSYGEAKFYVDKNKNLTDVNGDYSVSQTYGAFTCPGNLYIFATNNNGAVYAKSFVTLYTLKIYDNGVLARDFVPCISPTGSVGLYDLIGGQFYGNSGTGVFLAGPRRAALPSGYEQLEYIQSSGTQYINTDFTPTSATRVLMQVKVTNLTDTTALMGTRNSSSGTDSESYTLLIVSQKPRSDFFGGSKTGTANMPADKVDIDRNGRACKVGSETITNDAKTASASRPLYLMACNTAGTASFPASLLIWSCQIKEGESAERDYVPCKDAGGNVGLYDLVGAKFYGSAGSGKFLAGPAISWPEAEESEAPAGDLDPYTWYESDVPTVPLLAQYRGNVAAVRAVLQLPEGTPEPPGTMAQLTTAGANSMEAVLLAVDLILNHIPAAVRHCGVTVCGSKGVMA